MGILEPNPMRWLPISLPCSEHIGNNAALANRASRHRWLGSEASFCDDGPIGFDGSSQAWEERRDTLFIWSITAAREVFSATRRAPDFSHWTRDALFFRPFLEPRFSLLHGFDRVRGAVTCDEDRAEQEQGNPELHHEGQTAELPHDPCTLRLPDVVGPLLTVPTAVEVRGLAGIGVPTWGFRRGGQLARGRLLCGFDLTW
jgi:hypothetical protein